MKSIYFTQQNIRTPRTIKRLAVFITTAFFLLISSSLWAQDVLLGLNSDGGAEGKGTLFSYKTDTKAFTIIKGFADWGQYPKSDLVKGNDGNLYGMTPQGGTYNYGTIFRITPAGDMTILKHFDLKVDGGAPIGSLIVGKDGNFYGLTSNGGAYYGGVIFRFTQDGQYTILKSFNPGVDGYAPQGHLVQTADGTFYGVTNLGGPNGNGTVFKYIAGSTYTVLKSFNGTTEGGRSYGSLVQGNDGAFYGMTYLGGNNKYGVIFRITSGGSYSVIRHLNGTLDGANPTGDLILAKDGFLYGMAADGGTNYNGTIFRINNTGTSFSVLKAMSAGLQGGYPRGSLVQSSDGSFYGMAYSISGGYNGSVFKLSGGTLTAIKKFTAATEGGSPYGSLVFGADGALYGMTYSGGKQSAGTIFRLTTGGSFSVLSHLNGSGMGNVPQSSLALGKDSAYFGVTHFGGAYNYGTVFKTCGGVTTLVKSFSWNTDGAYPTSGLVRDKAGNLYGTTTAGGAKGGGTIFKISTTGAFSVIRHMTAATDGAGAEGTLVFGTDSSLYGTAYNGGTNGAGTIFKINRTGTTFNVLHHFVAATEGSASHAGLVLYKDGFFYGLTGTNTHFFKINSSGAFSLISTFTNSTDGSDPYASLIVGTDLNFYGTTSVGGTYNSGVVFRITSAGAITRLRQLNPATDGGRPKGRLAQGSDGTVYGTNSMGGTNGVGTLFKVVGTSYSVLRHLKMATDGGTPLGGLIIAPRIALVANAQSGLTTTEDIAKAITLTGSGASGLTFNVLIKPRHGAVSIGTAAARTYTPAKNYYGLDSFAFTSNLGCLSSAPAWVKINITPVNDTPALAPISNKTVVKGTQLLFIATATDPDPGQTKTFSLIGAPTGAAINATTGAFSWTPATTGTFTFKVRVTDNGAPVLYSEQSVTVTVTATALTTVSVNTTTTLAKQSEANVTKTRTSLFPNPVASQLTLTFGAPVQQVLVTIADVKGAVVYSKIETVADQQLQLDVAAFKSGAYFLQVQSIKGTEVLKFVKF